ncbi:hypothetical protein DIPPA_30143 [Diplonema papillatum]|nr:hypothetical protein DIPPA_30143 [Diplonema papillatum]
MRTRTSKTQGPTTEDLYSSILLLPAPPHGRRPSRSRRRSGTRGGKAAPKDWAVVPHDPSAAARAAAAAAPPPPHPLQHLASHWESCATRTRRRARKVGYLLGDGRPPLDQRAGEGAAAQVLRLNGTLVPAAYVSEALSLWEGEEETWERREKQRTAAARDAIKRRIAEGYGLLGSDRHAGEPSGGLPAHSGETGQAGGAEGRPPFRPASLRCASGSEARVRARAAAIKLRLRARRYYAPPPHPPPGTPRPSSAPRPPEPWAAAQPRGRSRPKARPASAAVPQADNTEPPGRAAPAGGNPGNTRSGSVGSSVEEPRNETPSHPTETRVDNAASADGKPVEKTRPGSVDSSVEEPQNEMPPGTAVFPGDAHPTETRLDGAASADGEPEEKTRPGGVDSSVEEPQNETPPGTAVSPGDAHPTETRLDGAASANGKPEEKTRPSSVGSSGEEPQTESPPDTAVSPGEGHPAVTRLDGAASAGKESREDARPLEEPRSGTQPGSIAAPPAEVPEGEAPAASPSVESSSPSGTSPDKFDGPAHVRSPSATPESPLPAAKTPGSTPSESSTCPLGAKDSRDQREGSASGALDAREPQRDPDTESESDENTTRVPRQSTDGAPKARGTPPAEAAGDTTEAREQRQTSNSAAEGAAKPADQHEPDDRRASQNGGAAARDGSERSLSSSGTVTFTVATREPPREKDCGPMMKDNPTHPREARQVEGGTLSAGRSGTMACALATNGPRREKDCGLRVDDASANQSEKSKPSASSPATMAFTLASDPPRSNGPESVPSAVGNSRTKRHDHRHVVARAPSDQRRSKRDTSSNDDEDDDCTFSIESGGPSTSPTPATTPRRHGPASQATAALAEGYTRVTPCDTLRGTPMQKAKPNDQYGHGQSAAKPAEGESRFVPYAISNNPTRTPKEAQRARLINPISEPSAGGSQLSVEPVNDHSAADNLSTAASVQDEPHSTPSVASKDPPQTRKESPKTKPIDKHSAHSTEDSLVDEMRSVPDDTSKDPTRPHEEAQGATVQSSGHSPKATQSAAGSAQDESCFAPCDASKDPTQPPEEVQPARLIEPTNDCAVGSNQMAADSVEDDVLGSGAGGERDLKEKEPAASISSSNVSDEGHDEVEPGTNATVAARDHVTVENESVSNPYSDVSDERHCAMEAGTDGSVAARDLSKETEQAANNSYGDAGNEGRGKVEAGTEVSMTGRDDVVDTSVHDTVAAGADLMKEDERSAVSNLYSDVSDEGHTPPAIKAGIEGSVTAGDHVINKQEPAASIPCSDVSDEDHSAIEVETDVSVAARDHIIDEKEPAASNPYSNVNDEGHGAVKAGTSATAGDTVTKEKESAADGVTSESHRAFEAGVDSSATRDVKEESAVSNPYSATSDEGHSPDAAHPKGRAMNEEESATDDCNNEGHSAFKAGTDCSVAPRDVKEEESAVSNPYSATSDEGHGADATHANDRAANEEESAASNPYSVASDAGANPTAHDERVGSLLTDASPIEHPDSPASKPYSDADDAKLSTVQDERVGPAEEKDLASSDNHGKAVDGNSDAGAYSDESFCELSASEGNASAAWREREKDRKKQLRKLMLKRKAKKNKKKEQATRAEKAGVD